MKSTSLRWLGDNVEMLRAIVVAVLLGPNLEDRWRKWHGIAGTGCQYLSSHVSFRILSPRADRGSEGILKSGTKTCLRA